MGALEIGANALLTRAGAMYHDVGKLKNPMYFIENQSSNLNPHDEIEFDESAEIINTFNEEVIAKLGPKTVKRSSDFKKVLLDLQFIPFYYIRVNTIFLSTLEQNS